MFCDFQGKNILITGASSGLGRATSILISQLGGQVCLVGRDTDRLQETMNLMSGDGHMIAAFDLAIHEQYPELFTRVLDEMGPLSGLAHFAGLYSTLPLRVSKPDKLDELMKVNLYAFVELVRQLTNKKQFIHEKGCSVLAISSVVALRGIATLSAYAATKAAIDAVVRCFAIELASRKIRVNSIAPGHIDTPMTQAMQLNTAQLEAISNLHPLGLGQSLDVANLAAFLLAEESQWITGTTIPIDGGFLAR